MPRHVLQDAFAAAVARCQAGEELIDNLPEAPERGRLIILGAGKATAKMAEVAEAHYLPRVPADRLSGLIVIPDGEDAILSRVEVLHASHPFPDQRSETAARRMLSQVDNLESDDRVVMLLSGGASSLLCAPVDGITLDEKRKITEALFAAGAPIDELNAVRKFLSAIKGGKLARACWPASVTTLAISDVVGDDPDVIGSAPTVRSEVDVARIRQLLSRHGLDRRKSLAARLGEQPADDDRPFPDTTYRIVAKPMDALLAAEAVAKNHGYAATVLGDDIEGEARVRARQMADQYCDADHRKIALISGGEITVSFAANQPAGYGGPNREFALALALAIDGKEGTSALIADTDGVDGQTGDHGPVAGAIVDATSVVRGKDLGLDAADYLDRHDSGRFFERLGDEIVTGPTHTNVNDFRMMLID